MYYELDYSIDIKVIGSRSDNSLVEINKKSFDSKEKWKIWDDFFDMPPIMENLDTLYDEIGIIRGFISKTTKIIDLMTYWPYFNGGKYVISEEMKNVLAEFKLKSCYYYPIELIQNNEVVNRKYYILITKYFDYDIFDFTKSIIYESNLPTSKIIKIENEEDYLNAYGNSVRAVAIKKECFEDYDLFGLKLFGCLIISEKLKDALSNMSGMEYKKKNIIFV